MDLGKAVKVKTKPVFGCLLYNNNNNNNNNNNIIIILKKEIISNFFESGETIQSPTQFRRFHTCIKRTIKWTSDSSANFDWIHTILARVLAVRTNADFCVRLP
jgi:hypothetical protein